MGILLPTFAGFHSNLQPINSIGNRLFRNWEIFLASQFWQVRDSMWFLPWSLGVPISISKASSVATLRKSPPIRSQIWWHEEPPGRSPRKPTDKPRFTNLPGAIPLTPGVSLEVVVRRWIKSHHLWRLGPFGTLKRQHYMRPAQKYVQHYWVFVMV